MERPGVAARRGFLLASLALISSIAGCGDGGDSSASPPDTAPRPIVAPVDSDPPAVQITGPVAGGSYASSGAAVTLSGSATDNVGVDRVVWSNNRGGSGTASGGASWNTGPIPLQSGVNLITVTALDPSGNSGTADISVSYATTAGGDTIVPAVTITSPTTDASYAATAATLHLAGTAGDNQGVARVSWSNNRGGSGTASGTQSWSVAGIALQSGSNVITVTAVDLADNTATDTLTVTYTAPDTTVPTVTITSPTGGAAYTTSSGSIALGGSAGDDVGVVQVRWSNSRGSSGTASGTTAWSAKNIALQSGTNVLTVTAVDAAGNGASDSLTVTYNVPDTTPPSVTGLSPANGATNVAVTTTLTATFSEPVTNVTTSTFRVNGVTGTVSLNGNTATFRPATALTGGTGYTATVSGGAAGVKDLAGNPLASDRVWSFTTAPVLATASYRASWNAVPDPTVTGYRLYYATAPLGSGQPLGTLDTTATSLVFVPGNHGLMAGATLYLAVTSLGENGAESPLSEQVSILLE
ncbi:Ig-like domain-containing protein [Sulfurifustis variabilis]|uniref:Ig-like domain-containing protein n=1 Tax=Sulfurifustis variabilis TaxID=1675686 RepID=UPI0014757666|nr:Ig-like domain-containing protein [Sulfurifustis variabilis]